MKDMKVLLSDFSERLPDGAFKDSLRSEMWQEHFNVRNVFADCWSDTCRSWKQHRWWWWRNWSLKLMINTEGFSPTFCFIEEKVFIPVWNNFQINRSSGILLMSVRKWWRSDRRSEMFFLHVCSCQSSLVSVLTLFVIRQLQQRPEGWFLSRSHKHLVFRELMTPLTVCHFAFGGEASCWGAQKVLQSILTQDLQ